MGSGSFDFKDVERLQKQLEALQSDQDAFCRKCANELAARLLGKVIKRTPVGVAPKLDDTKAVKIKGASGKSRSFLSKSGAIYQKYWSGYQGGNLRRSWTVGEVIKTGDNYEIEVINPVKYATYVENGHRQAVGKYVPALGKRLKKAWVPGKFMLRISEQQLQQMAPALLEKKLEARLKEVFRA